MSLLADLDEQIGDMHAALEQQLLQQLHVQDLLRCGRRHVDTLSPKYTRTTTHQLR